MRKLWISTILIMVLFYMLSVSIVYSNDLSGFKSIIIRKMKWLRMIDNDESIIDVYGVFGGYNKSMITILVDNYKLLNRSMNTLLYIIEKYVPPVIVIASNIRLPYAIIEKNYGIKIDTYEYVLTDLRYGLLVPVSALSFDTVFPNTIGFRGVYGSAVIKSNILGRAFLYNGENIERIPVFLEVEIEVSGKTVTLFLIGSPYVFVTTDPYLDYSLYYNNIRDYIVSKARSLGARGTVIINALLMNVTIALQPIEEQEPEAPVFSGWEGIRDFWPQVNIPFVKLKFLPPSIKPWNVIIMIPYPIILIYLIVLLIVVLQLYTVFYGELYIHRKPPPPYSLREVYESGKSMRISRLYMPRDPLDYIMMLTRGCEEPDILIIESYNFLDKLFREKIGYGIDKIVRDNKVLSMASGVTGIKEDELLNMLSFLYRIYVNIVSEQYVPTKKLESMLNRILTIVCTLAKRLKGYS